MSFLNLNFTRSNSAAFASLRVCVCVCSSCQRMLRLPYVLCVSLLKISKPNQRMNFKQTCLHYSNNKMQLLYFLTLFYYHVSHLGAFLLQNYCSSICCRTVL